MLKGSLILFFGVNGGDSAFRADKTILWHRASQLLLVGFCKIHRHG